MQQVKLQPGVGVAIQPAKLSGEWATAIGVNAQAIGDRSFALGDNTIAVHNDEVVIGAKLFGKPMPPCIIHCLQAHPQEFKALIRSILDQLLENSK